MVHSLTTEILATLCSPSGKLVQIEYALQAVADGAPSVGIKARNGVVIAVEKKLKSFLYDESSITRVSGDMVKGLCTTKIIGPVLPGPEMNL